MFAVNVVYKRELCMIRVIYYGNLPKSCVNKTAIATADFDNVMA
jgi:hypothetical protein